MSQSILATFTQGRQYPAEAHAQKSVDKFRPGYPRYAALLESHTAFQNFRRFTRVRMRLLLGKQDEISTLEHTLDQIDSAEERPLYLGSMRRDVNPQRQQVLQNLKAALKEYDEMLDQSRKSLAMPTSRCRDVQNLKRWLDGTGCLDRQESAYLEHEHDLGNLADPLDNSVVYTESIVEDCTFWVERLIEKAFPQWRSQRYRVTSDKHVLILGPRLQNLSRVLTISAATLIILAPTVILLNLSAPDARIVASIFSAAFFLTILSFFTRAKTVEVFTAGASYAAVLVAFTASSAPKDP